ncbi:MAG: DUF4430 domain-containing protein [Candidatus Hadarchaeales archaeon]
MRKSMLEILAALMITGVICFGAGVYAVGGKTTAYATTREISVHVTIETKNSGIIEKTVKIRDGMSAFDALLKVTDTRTQYWESFDSSIITSVGGEELGPNEGYVFMVNGESPSASMSDCQLHDGDNILIKYISW